MKNYFFHTKVYKSGNIADWRFEQQIKKTRERRPDLLEGIDI